jgi:hypothetical protein
MSARALVSRGPLILLGLMTLDTFGGPLLFGYVLRGGRSPDWPPDRPIEWYTLGGILGLALVLMIVAIAMAVANQRALARIRAELHLQEPGAPK